MKLRIGVAALAGLICVAVLGTIAAGGVLWRTAESAKEFESLSAQVRVLQEELGKKEQALMIQEKRLKEMQETRSHGALSPSASVETAPVTGVASPRPQIPPDEAPLTALAQSDGPRREGSAPPAGTKLERASESRKLAALEGGSGRSSSTESAVRTGPPVSDAARSQGKAAVINFDAQDVTSVQQTSGSGTLTFRLVKDQPEVRFAGYLFVFLEMADRRGENKIFAYPKQTRLGEGDLPWDYRDGESIAFKFNSRVELPFSDVRQGAGLSRVSILLYGENGKIVFQRGFDAKELKTMTGKGAKVDGSKTRTREKRQAL